MVLIILKDKQVAEILLEGCLALAIGEACAKLQSVLTVPRGLLEREKCASRSFPESLRPTVKSQWPSWHRHFNIIFQDMCLNMPHHTFIFPVNLEINFFVEAFYFCLFNR